MTKITITKEQHEKLKARRDRVAEILGCTPERALELLMQAHPEHRRQGLQMVADDYQAVGEFKLAHKRNPKRTRVQMFKDAMREAKRRRKVYAGIGSPVT